MTIDARRHHFRCSQAIERKWAPRLDQAIRDSYPLSRVDGVTLTDEFRGIDRIVVDDSGHRVGIEYKIDEQWSRTGNVFLETISNATTRRAGWLMTCQATWLLYFLTPSRVLVYFMPELRRVGERWATRYPIRPAHNDGYDTLGICVPVGIAESAAESVSALDHGDGIVLQCRTR